MGLSSSKDDFHRLGQTIFSVTEELHKTHVSKDLKLLPNFVADVPVVRVKLSEARLKCVNVVFQREFLLAQCMDSTQYVEGPSTSFDTQVAQFL